VSVDTCDVLVIGGGPAGSTIGALLAQRGHSVVLLDKATHPRFHIGESLLPCNMAIFERLGVTDRLEAIGVVKRGADFTDEIAGTAARTYWFSKAANKSYPYAFQVRRDQLDDMLLRACGDKGVCVMEATHVTGVDLNEHGRSRVSASDATGRARVWDAGFVVDASGRDSLLARNLRWRRRNPTHSSAAIFGHYTGVERRSGEAAGNISIYWFDHGWIWMIPLADGLMSVGAVCEPSYLKSRDCSPEEFLGRTVGPLPSVGNRMRAARLASEVRTAGNYSYGSARAGGRGFLLVGDAFCFIDPVFSSGVFLAMSSASLGADVVDSCLADPSRSRTYVRSYERQMKRAIRRFSWFIYRFRSPSMRRLFTSVVPPARIEEAVTTVLAGDVFGHSGTALGLAGFKTVFYAHALTRGRGARATLGR
jgi:flavin-dependent dehydrogenase